MINNTTQTNTTGCQQQYSREPHDDITSTTTFRVVFGAALITIFILTTFAGTFTSYVIFKHNMVNKKSWCYLLLLTVSDTAACLFKIPFIFSAIIDERVLQYQAVCDLSGFTMTFFPLLSIYILASISCHRHYTISKPFVSLHDSNNIDIVVTLFLSIAISLFLAVSPTAGFSAYAYIPGRKLCIFCSLNPNLDFLYLCLMVVLGYLFPITVLICVSLRIMCIVRNQRKGTKLRRRTSQHKQVRESRAMVKTTLMVIGGFFILFTPTVVYIALGMRKVKIPLLYSHLCYIIILLQGTVNAAIYCFRHRAFKEELGVIFCGHERYRERSTASSSGNSVSRTTFKHTRSIVKQFSSMKASDTQRGGGDYIQELDMVSEQ